jgi:hypothetical protein
MASDSVDDPPAMVGVPGAGKLGPGQRSPNERAAQDIERLLRQGKYPASVTQ